MIKIDPDSPAPVVIRALSAMSAADEHEIREALHPYLHWTRRDGAVIRGRSRMLEQLAGSLPELPDEIELRDGQIYRWVEKPH
jgi:hypothetical protein